jgi:hypothetical protein
MANSSSEEFWSDGDFSDADMELLQAFKRHKPVSAGGSLPGKSANILREFEEAHERLIRYYFRDNPLYNNDIFRRRYRMSKGLFLRIAEGVKRRDPYFVQKADATGRMGISTIVKVTLAIRLLAYGAISDQYDECLQISESTGNQILEKFCDAIYAEYGHEYLERYPSPEEIAEYQELNSLRGFPGLFGGLDCMHWHWQNCPAALRGQYQDRDGSASLILEACASPELRIWSFNFGHTGANNDINVIDKSSFIPDIIQGKYESPQYEINGTTFQHPYFLVDGIYPALAIFAQTISKPANMKESYYATKQEAIRKDIERCFGLLQSKWYIVVKPSRRWRTSFMVKIMRCCVILHNMILEDEGARAYCKEVWELNENAIQIRPEVFPNSGEAYNPFKQVDSSVNSIAAALEALTDAEANQTLKNALVEHLWRMRGASR